MTTLQQEEVILVEPQVVRQAPSIEVRLAGALHEPGDPLVARGCLQLRQQVVVSLKLELGACDEPKAQTVLLARPPHGTELVGTVAHMRDPPGWSDFACPMISGMPIRRAKTVETTVSCKVTDRPPMTLGMTRTK